MGYANVQNLNVDCIYVSISLRDLALQHQVQWGPVNLYCTCTKIVAWICSYLYYCVVSCYPSLFQRKTLCKEFVGHGYTPFSATIDSKILSAHRKLSTITFSINLQQLFHLLFLEKFIQCDNLVYNMISRRGEILRLTPICLQATLWTNE